MLTLPCPLFFGRWHNGRSSLECRSIEFHVFASGFAQGIVFGSLRRTFWNPFDESVGLAILFDEVEGIVKLACGHDRSVVKGVVFHGDDLVELGVYGGSSHPAIVGEFIHFGTADRDDVDGA